MAIEAHERDAAVVVAYPEAFLSLLRGSDPDDAPQSGSNCGRRPCEDEWRVGKPLVGAESRRVGKLANVLRRFPLRGGGAPVARRGERGTRPLGQTGPRGVPASLERAVAKGEQRPARLAERGLEQEYRSRRADRQRVE